MVSVQKKSKAKDEKKDRLSQVKIVLEEEWDCEELEIYFTALHKMMTQQTAKVVAFTPVFWGILSIDKI